MFTPNSRNEEGGWMPDGQNRYTRVGPFRLDYSVSVMDVLMLIGIIFGGLQYINTIDAKTERNASDIEYLVDNDVRLEGEIDDLESAVIKRLDSINAKIDQMILREIQRENRKPASP